MHMIITFPISLVNLNEVKPIVGMFPYYPNGKSSYIVFLILMTMLMHKKMMVVITIFLPQDEMYTRIYFLRKKKREDFMLFISLSNQLKGNGWQPHRTEKVKRHAYNMHAWNAHNTSDEKEFSVYKERPKSS